MKTVFITGAGGNLGVAAVRTFSTNGWRVVAVVSSGKIPATDSNAVIYREADLRLEKETATLVDGLVNEFGAPDLTLLLVGGFEPGDLNKANGDALKRMYALNFETAYFTARPLIPHIQKQGKLIFIGARPAMDAQAGKNLIAYGLSKSMLFKLSEYLNAAAGRTIAHIVVFQALDTPQNRASMPGADKSKWVSPDRVAQRILQMFAGDDGMVVEITA